MSAVLLRPRMFSQWVRGRDVPFGRLSWPQFSGVWGIRSRERTARYRISTARAGNRKRTKAIYHSPASGCAASRAVRLSSSPCRISMGPPPLLKHNCIVCYYSIFSGKCTALPSPASFHRGGAAGGICAGFPEVSAFFRSFSRGISLLLLTSVEKSFKI